MTGQRGFWLATALKALLVGLLLFGAFAGAQQFEGKAFLGRLLTYPIAGLVVPAGWYLAGRPRPYPHAVDALLVSPFLVDVVGNALGLYDTVWWWDDANHFVNWALLSGAFALLLVPAGRGRWSTLGLVVGCGAIAAILWELAEYVSFIRNSTELATAYEDTLGDLALGLSGSVVAGALAYRFEGGRSAARVAVDAMRQEPSR